MLKKCALMAALVLVLAPATAKADWLFTPNFGGTFGGTASGNEHMTYGASIGWMGQGIFGWEADLSYTPEFFEPGDGDIDFVCTHTAGPQGNNVARCDGFGLWGVRCGAGELLSPLVA